MTRAFETEVFAHKGARNGIVSLVEEANHVEKILFEIEEISKRCRGSPWKRLSKRDQGSRIGDLHRTSQS